MESWGKRWGSGLLRGLRTRMGNLLARSARRGGIPLLLCVTLLCVTLGQLAAAGFGGVAVAYAAGSRGVPNTYARFRATANAATLSPKRPQFGPWRVPHGSDGLAPAQGPTSTGVPTTHPITITLDTRFLDDGTLNRRQHAGGPEGAPESVVWFTSSEGMLELGLTEHSIALGSATVGGQPARGGAAAGINVNSG